MLREKLQEAGLPAELATLLPYDALKALGVDFVGFTELLIPTLLATERERFSKHVQETTGDRNGILSLSANPTSLLMWAHYASSHFGFAIEFDASHRFFNQQRNPREILRHLLPVTYAVERPAITMFDPEADEETWGQRLIAQAFLTKSVDWSYEREWRMFLKLDDTEHPHDVKGRFHLFPYSPEAVTAVILGARCTTETRDKIEAALRGDLSHVELRQARISATRFKVLVKL